ncbi:transposase [Streptomyces diastaticus]
MVRRALRTAAAFTADIDSPPSSGLAADLTVSSAWRITRVIANVGHSKERRVHACPVHVSCAAASPALPTHDAYRVSAPGVSALGDEDCTRLPTVTEAIRLPRPGPGWSRARPGHVLADKGHSSKAIRIWLRRKGHRPHDARAGRSDPRPVPARQQRRRRPPAFDRKSYKRRNVVRRRFARLRQWRGIATRTTRPPSPTRQPSPSRHS